MTPPGNDRHENLTRKQRRDQAREQRKAAEAAAAAAAGRRKRLIQLGSVGAAVIVVIAVIVVLTSGGKGAGTHTATTTGSSLPVSKSEQSASVSTVTSLLAGIPQSGDVLGKPSAPVTLQYFGDLECPICREFTLGALPGIISKEVRTGKLRIEYRSFSTATSNAEAKGAEPHEMFKTQQVAAYAAGKQNLAWNYIELFYHEQGEEDSGYVTEGFLQSLAQQVPGLSLKTWTADRSETSLATGVLADEKAALKDGFEGTPSFMIGKTGGPLTQFNPSSLKESSAFEPAIEKYAAS